MVRRDHLGSFAHSVSPALPNYRYYSVSITVGANLIASGHLTSSDKAPGSRRRNENGKLERLGTRLAAPQRLQRKHNLAGLPPEQMLVAAEAIKGECRLSG